MHVMAIDGSPRKEKSSTYHIIAPLLEGMRGAVAATELVHPGHYSKTSRPIHPARREADSPKGLFACKPKKQLTIPGAPPTLYQTRN